MLVRQVFREGCLLLNITCVDQLIYTPTSYQVRSLLTNWSESILDIPTLFLLGYGGIDTPAGEHDDDLSSFGHNDDDDEPLETQLYQHAMATEENEEIIAHMSATSSPLIANKIDKPLEKDVPSPDEPEDETTDYMPFTQALDNAKGGNDDRPKEHATATSKKMDAQTDEVHQNGGDETDNSETQDPDVPKDPTAKKNASDDKNKALNVAKGYPESAEKNKQAQPPGKENDSSQKEKKRTKGSVVYFEDSDEEDEEPMPAQRTRSIAHRQTSGGARKPREDWTLDETRALIEGVREHGKGNWALIQIMKAPRLDRVDNKQIKDRWRNVEGKVSSYMPKEPAPPVEQDDMDNNILSTQAPDYDEEDGDHDVEQSGTVARKDVEAGIGSATSDEQSIKSETQGSEVPVKRAAKHKRTGTLPSSSDENVTSMPGTKRNNLSKDLDLKVEDETVAPPARKKAKHVSGRSLTPDEDWTDDETRALIEGECEFGRHWAMIKKAKAPRLDRKDKRQMKDHWRYLSNKVVPPL
jgi:hypothetical protein